jgi:hypothetical protein
VAVSRWGSRSGRVGRCGRSAGNAIYVACEVVGGSASVVDDDELAEFAWSTGKQLTEYIPYSFYGPVQEYLDSSLPR